MAYAITIHTADHLVSILLYFVFILIPFIYLSFHIDIKVDISGEIQFYVTEFWL